MVTGSDLNVEGLEGPDLRVGKTIPSGVCCVPQSQPPDGLKILTCLVVETTSL